MRIKLWNKIPPYDINISIFSLTTLILYEIGVGGFESMTTKIKDPYDEITYWEKIAKTKWGSYKTEIEKRAILKAHKFLKEQTTALEIGCEGGRWSRRLTKLGWNMICTDIDLNTLQICQRRIPSAKCILVKPTDSKIPCESRSIKLLLCMQVNPVIISDWFLPEALRTLEPGGLLIATITNPLSFRGVLYRIACKIIKNKIEYGFYTHTQPYHKFKKKITRMGFRVTFEEGYCWLPFSLASNSPLIPTLTELEHRLGLRNIINLSPTIVFIAKKI